MLRRTLVPAVAAALVAASLFLAGALPASACSLAGEDVTVSPSSVRAGEVVTVTAQDVYYFDGPLGADCSGLAVHSGSLEIGLVDRGAADPEVIALGSATADDGDVAPVELTVPPGTPAAEYLVVLLIDAGGETGEYPSRAHLTVVATEQSTSSTTSTTAAPSTTTAPAATATAARPAFTG